MSRSMMFGAAALAVITAPVATAIAQDITVTGPRAERLYEPGSTMEIYKLTASDRVYYGDLNLNSMAGRDELNARVKYVAKQICNRLEKLNRGNIPLSNDEPCLRDAVAGAQDQVYTAIRFGG